MHQIVVRVQGGEGASLPHVIAALDLAKGRIAAGMSNGSSQCGAVRFDFEVREVDAAHAFQDLLAEDGQA